MQGIKGYRWSRCNVARGNVSRIVALQCMLADGFNLRIPLLCFHIVREHIEAKGTHITLQPVTRFLQSTHFSGVYTISSAEKRACARKLRTLSINYTQLAVKVKFFSKKVRYLKKSQDIEIVFRPTLFHNLTYKGSQKVLVFNTTIKVC